MTVAATDAMHAVEHDGKRATWTFAHSEAAEAQGWDVFDSEGSVSGPYQVQSFDEPRCVLDDEAVPDITDGDAWLLVQRADSDHTRAALAFLAVANPLERARILAWPTTVDGHWDYDNDCEVFDA